jgi:hypothetical protein
MSSARLVSRWAIFVVVLFFLVWEAILDGTPPGQVLTSGRNAATMALSTGLLAMLGIALWETILWREAQRYQANPELLRELADSFVSDDPRVRERALRVMALACGEPFGAVPLFLSPQQERTLSALYRGQLRWQMQAGPYHTLDEIIGGLEFPTHTVNVPDVIPVTQPDSTGLPEFLSRPDKSASTAPDGSPLTNRFLEQLGLRRTRLWQRMGQALVDTVIDWKPLGDDRPPIAEEVEELPPMPPDRFVDELWAPTHAALRRTAAAINAAPTGRILEAAEPAAGQALAELWSLAVEVGIQMRIDAADNSEAVPQGRWARGLRRMALGGPGTPISSSSRPQENAG